MPSYSAYDGSIAVINSSSSSCGALGSNNHSDTSQLSCPSGGADASGSGLEKNLVDESNDHHDHEDEDDDDYHSSWLRGHRRVSSMLQQLPAQSKIAWKLLLTKFQVWKTQVEQSPKKRSMLWLVVALSLVSLSISATLWTRSGSPASTVVHWTPLDRSRRLSNCHQYTSEIKYPIVVDMERIQDEYKTNIKPHRTQLQRQQILPQAFMDNNPDNAHKGRLIELSALTEPREYARRIINPPGVEHYSLLRYLTQYHADCRAVVDIGTGMVASALALGAAGTRVHSFDLPGIGRRERQKAFRDKDEDRWTADLVEAGLELEFHEKNVMRMPPERFIKFMNSTWLIFLDTNHLPYSKPFEREFFDRLMAMQYKGIVVLDEIHGAGTFGGETERWWYELKDHAEERGYQCHDVTAIGHFTGTGIIDFSGKVKIINRIGGPTD